MKLDEIIKAKMHVYDIVKDSPLILYITFYEPIHEWLSTIARDWNPILQFVLNIIAIIWGVSRLIPVFKKWIKGEPVTSDDLR
jgi:hypothetical protein